MNHVYVCVFIQKTSCIKGILLPRCEFKKSNIFYKNTIFKISQPHHLSVIEQSILTDIWSIYIYKGDREKYLSVGLYHRSYNFNVQVPGELQNNQLV